METVLIVIAAIVLLALLAPVSTRARARKLEERRIERERTTHAVEGHRQEAEALAGRVQESTVRAEEHREAADRHLREAQRHAQAAAELEDRSQRSKRFAKRHEDAAGEQEKKLEQL